VEKAADREITFSVAIIDIMMREGEREDTKPPLVLRAVWVWSPVNNECHAVGD